MTRGNQVPWRPLSFQECLVLETGQERDQNRFWVLSDEGVPGGLDGSLRGGGLDGGGLRRGGHNGRRRDVGGTVTPFGDVVLDVSEPRRERLFDLAERCRDRPDRVLHRWYSWVHLADPSAGVPGPGYPVRRTYTWEGAPGATRVPGPVSVDGMTSVFPGCSGFGF